MGLWHHHTRNDTQVVPYNAVGFLIVIPSFFGKARNLIERVLGYRKRDSSLQVLLRMTEGRIDGTMASPHIRNDTQVVPYTEYLLKKTKILDKCPLFVIQ